ncbi:MAG: glycosyltransferase [Bacteroidetes bacterium]|nr:glycosyltransferase [Bacteroidota bacterium]
MKTVKNLYNRLNTAKDFKEKYPEYDPEDKKIHVLFLSACINESSYYRLILPALELNRTGTHAAIVNDIHRWDFNKMFDDYDNPIDYRLVQWADYVVMPVLFSDASYIIRDLREINSDIEFVMDVDFNYHELPDYHPNYNKLGKDLKDTLLANFFIMDILSAPNTSILNYYGQLAQKQSEDIDLYLERYANLLSHYTFEEVKQTGSETSERIKIGLLLDPSQAGDLKSIEKPLTSLMEIYKGKVELVIYGWTGSIADENNLLKGIPVRFIKPINFFDYHARLRKLDFDIGLLPLVNNLFNTSGKALTRYLDFSTSMVPVIVPNMQPFQKLIKEGENGFIASSDEEWISKTTTLIENADLRREVGAYAHKFVWENFSYTPKAIQRLRSIFI